MPKRIPVRKRTVTLGVYRCPVHRDFLSVSVDYPASGLGTRVTPSKCCGRWEAVKTWPLGVPAWQEIIRLCEDAIEYLERDQ